MKKLSIIIPVYKVEKYIKKCLESCLSDPNIEEYEVIIVNDETPDNSMEIVESFTSTYRNLRIVSKKNGGLSSARNAGLKIAEGEYIWFVDSDDYISNAAISSVLSDIARYDDDVFFYDIIRVDEQTKIESYRKMASYENSVSKTGFDWLRYNENMYPMAQMFVFKKSFLFSNNLFFKEGILHEDIEFKWRFFQASSRIRYVPRADYYYLLRSTGSISTDFSKKRSSDMCSIVMSEIQYVKAMKSGSNRDSAALSMFRNFEGYLVFIAKYDAKSEYANIREFGPDLRIILRSIFFKGSVKRNVKMILAFISPMLLLKIFKLGNKIRKQSK